MIKNGKGVTLIELVIVLALLSFVMMIGFSVFSFGFKSFNTQTKNIDNQSNVRYAIGFITKEVRKAEWNNITVAESKKEIKINDVTYKLDTGSHVIKKGESQLVMNIGDFYVDKDKDDTEITLIITSLTNTSGRAVTLTSKIYHR